MTAPTSRIRTTISVDSEVHDIFKRMAAAAGMSVSRCMGEWLADTADGAQLIAMKMEEARKAPMAVMRELQSMLSGQTEMVEATILDVQRKSRNGGVDGGGAALATGHHPQRGSSAGQSVPKGKKPPSSNTGVL